jgi:hypothetical protein
MNEWRGVFSAEFIPKWIQRALMFFYGVCVIKLYHFATTLRTTNKEGKGKEKRGEEILYQISFLGADQPIFLTRTLISLIQQHFFIFYLQTIGDLIIGSNIWVVLVTIYVLA